MGRRSFRRADRLRRRVEYLRCYREGRRRGGPLFGVCWAAGPGPGPRLGIAVPRKVGSAVVRHRIKRRLREIFRRWEGRPALGAVDVVVQVRPPAAGAPFPQLERDLRRALGRIAESP